MSVAELKEKLIQQIKLSDDINLLKDISRMIEVEIASEKLFVLSKEQNAAIAEARLQIKNGDTLAAEQADHEIDEWFKK